MLLTLRRESAREQVLSLGLSGPAEALRGGRGQEAFFSTCWEANAEQILTWYSWRWSIEQTIRDSKQHGSVRDGR